MGTSKFWNDAAERALKTFVQALIVALLGGQQAFNVFTVDWKGAIGIALGAAVVSLLTSIGSSFKGDPTSASLVSKPKVPGGV